MQTEDQRSAEPPSDLCARLRDGSARVAGVLSGTSADGIDVALARFEAGQGRRPGRPVLVAFDTLDFDECAPPAGGEALSRRVRRVLDGEPLGLGELARLDRDLGRAFGRAARRVADANGVELDLVASHGQTVWHHDGTAGGAATLQLGDGCEVAEVAGCPAVSDFRARDVASGGEGAPLLALVDEELFPADARPLCVLNLGGISNLTWISGGGGRRAAFDTGPCNSLLDGFARRLLDRPFDRDGEVAARGVADEERVRAWGRHAFLDRPPPRSTGRDTFGEAWIDGLLEGDSAAGARGLAAEDALRTAVELVAECIARALSDFLPESAGVPIVAAGGGAHHPVLLEALARRTGRRVDPSSRLGVDPDAREALAFAVLGARRVLGVASEGWATGGGARLLGKLSG